MAVKMPTIPNILQKIPVDINPELPSHCEVPESISFLLPDFSSFGILDWNKYTISSLKITIDEIQTRHPYYAVKTNSSRVVCRLQYALFQNPPLDVSRLGLVR